MHSPWIERAVTDWQERFKDHVAELRTIPYDEKFDPIVIVKFKKPGTVNLSMHCIVYGRVLFVTGDVDDAVYEWNEGISIPWLAALELEYFNGKCRASPSGIRYRDWYPEAARVQFNMMKAEGPEALVALDTLGYTIEEVCGSKHEWNEFAYEADPHSGEPPFDAGLDIAHGCIGHWVALKRIHELTKA